MHTRNFHGLFADDRTIQLFILNNNRIAATAAGAFPFQMLQRPFQRTDADRRLDLLEYGARADGGGRAEGRRRDADDAQSCKKYDLDDALL